MKAATGVARLDELLAGGFPRASATMVFGAPFIGKDLLARHFLLAGMRAGEPGIVVLTNAAAADVARDLAAMDPQYPEYEKAGLAHYVDAYSRAIGAEEPRANTEYLDGPMNLNGVALAVNNAERKAIAGERGHRLVFDSLSTLVAYQNVQTTFRFLQVLVGKGRRAGATSLYLLDAGMHADPEVQMLKHLMDGFVELREQDGKTSLRVDGAGVTESRGWIEYRRSATALELTGSFATGRIR